MVIAIINKILLVVFITAIANLCWHIFYAIQAWIKNDEQNTKYILTPRSLFLLGLSVAYVLTSIITGINL